MKTRSIIQTGPARPGEQFKRYEKMLSISKRFVQRAQKTRSNPDLKQLLQKI